MTSMQSPKGSKGRREEDAEKGGSVGLRQGEQGSNLAGERKLILQDGDLQVVTTTEQCALLCAAVMTHCFQHVAKGVSVM